MESDEEFLQRLVAGEGANVRARVGDEELLKEWSNLRALEKRLGYRWIRQWFWGCSSCSCSFIAPPFPLAFGVRLTRNFAKRESTQARSALGCM